MPDDALKLLLRFKLPHFVQGIRRDRGGAAGATISDALQSDAGNSKRLLNLNDPLFTHVL